MALNIIFYGFQMRRRESKVYRQSPELCFRAYSTACSLAFHDSSPSDVDNCLEANVETRVCRDSTDGLRGFQPHMVSVAHPWNSLKKAQRDNIRILSAHHSVR